MSRTLMGWTLLVLLALGLGVLAAWLYYQRDLHGRGDMAGDEMSVAPFTGITIAGSADVTLLKGEREAVAFVLPARQRGQLHIGVEKGVLAIRHDSTRHWWSALLGTTSRTPRITVTFRDLDTIAVSGTAKLRGESLRLPRLTVRVSGAGTLDLPDLATQELAIRASGAIHAALSGRAASQEIVVSGAADYRAADLASERALVDVRGAARVVLRAEKRLDVAISGAGTVEYFGDPQVTEHITGAGRVKRHAAALAAPALLSAGACPRESSQA